MSIAQRLPCFTHPANERRMVLEAIVKPVVLVLEADEYSSRLPMTRDDDLAIGRHAEKSRQVVFHCSQRDFMAP
jgi:hypothetical protein